MLSLSHAHVLSGHHFNLHGAIWAVLFTQIPPPVKRWMCSYNFFPFSIGFIYFLSALLLRLLWQSAFYLPSPFLCSQPISQNTITLAAPAAADADVLNSISIHCCNVRERDRYGGERIGGGADRFKTASTLFSPFLEGHYHRGLV